MVSRTFAGIELAVKNFFTVGLFEKRGAVHSARSLPNDIKKAAQELAEFKKADDNLDIDLVVEHMVNEVLSLDHIESDIHSITDFDDIIELRAIKLLKQIQKDISNAKSKLKSDQKFKAEADKLEQLEDEVANQLHEFETMYHDMKHGRYKKSYTQLNLSMNTMVLKFLHLRRTIKHAHKESRTIKSEGHQAEKDIHSLIKKIGKGDLSEIEEKFINDLDKYMNDVILFFKDIKFLTVMVYNFRQELSSSEKEVMESIQKLQRNEFPADELKLLVEEEQKLHEHIKNDQDHEYQDARFLKHQVA